VGPGRSKSECLGRGKAFRKKKGSGRSDVTAVQKRYHRQEEEDPGRGCRSYCGVRSPTKALHRSNKRNQMDKGGKKGYLGTLWVKEVGTPKLRCLGMS